MAASPRHAWFLFEGNAPEDPVDRRPHGQSGRLDSRRAALRARRHYRSRGQEPDSGPDRSRQVGFLLLAYSRSRGEGLLAFDCSAERPRARSWPHVGGSRKDWQVFARRRFSGACRRRRCHPDRKRNCRGNGLFMIARTRQWLDERRSAFCRSPFGCLVGLFLNRTFRGAADADAGELDLGVAVILVLLAMPGLLVSLLMLEKYGSLIRKETSKPGMARRRSEEHTSELQSR